MTKKLKVLTALVATTAMFWTVAKAVSANGWNRPKPVFADGNNKPTLEFAFATPVQIAATELPGKWYPDRYAPCAFLSPKTAPSGDKDTLEEDICRSGHQTPTPSFYNTQGRKYDLIANTYSITINLYVPIDWKTENERMAGFWATAFDSSDSVGDYPIIEFQGPITTDAGGPSYYPNGGVPGFYGWNNVTHAWDFIGLPGDFRYNTWVELTITLMPGTGFKYTVGDGHRGKSINSPFSDVADASLGNVILQGYNYDTDYSIFWDNLSFSFTGLVSVEGEGDNH